MLDNLVVLRLSLVLEIVPLERLELGLQRRGFAYLAEVADVGCGFLLLADLRRRHAIWGLGDEMLWLSGDLGPPLLIELSLHCKNC